MDLLRVWIMPCHAMPCHAIVAGYLGVIVQNGCIRCGGGMLCEHLSSYVLSVCEYEHTTIYDYFASR
jgi:hypothetical protein